MLLPFVFPFSPKSPLLDKKINVEYNLFIYVERIFYMTFINLFFIPVITVYILYKLKNRDLKFGAEYISLYMLSCVAVMISTEGFFYLLNLLFPVGVVTADSGLYSVVAVLAAVAVPFIAKTFKFEIKENSDEKTEETEKE